MTVGLQYKSPRDLVGIGRGDRVAIPEWLYLATDFQNKTTNSP